jgi:heat-inducible transcriptional repressor
MQRRIDVGSLGPREREVLETVVEQYIQTGAPVGSRLLSKTNTERLSPATIRSIMADLEEAGFLAHPHTSAGRVPTDLGYRFYVDTLPRDRRLSAGERRQLSETLHATGGLDSLVARCCRLLAAATSQVSVGTLPAVERTTFRHVELVKVSPERLLVLFVASSGLVHQAVVQARVPESQGELDRHARYLNTELEGRTLVEVRDHLADLMREERAAYDALVRRALELGSQYFATGPAGDGELVVDGTERFFARPDLSDFDRMKALIAALEDKSRILRILNSCLERPGLTTAIGSENAEPDLAGCSVIASSYGFGQTPAGALAVIGPTRMDYDRAMALVSYVAELLGSALASSRR